MITEIQSPAPPLVIGALGGSGTRAVTRILREAGWWMGGKLDASTEDSLPMREFLAKWFERLLDSDASPRMLEDARGDFAGAMTEHRRGMAHEGAPWGWKNPRNMWLIPFFATVYPRIRFVHMLRDGRDMSHSRNAYFLRWHGDRLLPGWRQKPRVAQLELWALGNRRAVATARSHPGVAYYPLRYEDLCSDPAMTIAGLLKFLGTSSERVEEYARQVRPSAGIGRWRSMHPVAMSDSAKAALEQFGYR